MYENFLEILVNLQAIRGCDVDTCKLIMLYEEFLEIHVLVNLQAVWGVHRDTKLTGPEKSSLGTFNLPGHKKSP